MSLRVQQEQVPLPEQNPRANKYALKNLAFKLGASAEAPSLLL
jgi:hypothetical protein